MKAYRLTWIAVATLTLSACAGSGGLLDPTLSQEEKDRQSQQFIQNLTTLYEIQSQSYHPPVFPPAPQPPVVVCCSR